MTKRLVTAIGTRCPFDLPCLQSRCASLQRLHLLHSVGCTNTEFCSLSLMRLRVRNRRCECELTESNQQIKSKSPVVEVGSSLEAEKRVEAVEEKSLEAEEMVQEVEGKH